MAVTDYTGAGKPLDDKRLTGANTTSAGKQYYRIWHDGQQILVPKGQSITKPLMPENVGVNTTVFGNISKGYFNRPTVEFRNTHDNSLFDRFNLKVARDELPTDPDIDWKEDLGIETVYLKINMVMAVGVVNYTGRFGGVIVMRYNGKGQNGQSNWCSDVLHFDEFNRQHLRGDFILVANPTAAQSAIGQDFNTAQAMHPKLPLTLLINDTIIVNGMSEMNVILQNPTFAVTLQRFDFEVLGGE